MLQKLSEFRTTGGWIQVMNRYLSRIPLGIRFASYVFTEPVPMDRFALPLRLDGVYALLIPDPTWGPWQLQPVFFGEIHSDREPWIGAAELTQCLRIAAGKALYVAVYPLLPHQTMETARIRKELIH